MNDQANLIPSESVCNLVAKAARAQRRAEKALDDARKAIDAEARRAGHHSICGAGVASYLREDPETGIAQAIFRNRSARQAESLIQGRIDCETNIAAKTIRAA